MIGFCVEPPHAQLGADQVAVGADEGFALVGVKLAGQAAAQDRFFEGVMKRLGVGLGVVSGKGDETGVVIDQDAELSGQRLAAGRKGRAPGRSPPSTGR